MNAIFFDRDNTLIIDDTGYLSQPEDVHYFEDTFLALKEISKLGFSFFLVTNQSGIGRGFFKDENVQKIYEKMQKDFQAHELELTDMAYCPHAPEDGCSCRKPSPEMINSLVAKWNIEKSKSFMVGDKISDVECARKAKVTPILLNTQNIKNNEKLCFKNLTEFATYLKNHLS